MLVGGKLVRDVVSVAKLAASARVTSAAEGQNGPSDEADEAAH